VALDGLLILNYKLLCQGPLKKLKVLFFFWSTPIGVNTKINILFFPLGIERKKEKGKVKTLTYLAQI